MSWRALARRYPVLAIRDFRLLLADRLLAPFSVGFSMVGVSFAVLKVTGSTADLSYVLAAQAAPMLVFSLVSGVFADRFRPQWVIIAGNIAVVAGEGVFGLLMLLTGHPPLWAMISLEAVNGIGGAVFYPASQALLPAARAGRAAAGGQLDQPAGDEHRADDRRRRGRRGGRGGRARAGADAVRDRHVGHGPADARDQGRPGRGGRAAAEAAPACSPSCARGGPSSAGTPGCGRR